MRTHHVLFAVAFAMGCKSETSFEQRDARLEVNPLLHDLGDVAVGSQIEAILDIDHLDGGAIDIRNVTITNIQGDHFSHDGQDQMTLDRGARLEVPILYDARDEGWHHATVTITHTGVDSPAVVDLRGHAALADATLSPLSIEYGEVFAPDSDSRNVVLSNNGNLDLVVGEATFTSPLFSLSLVLPQQVKAGEDLQLPVVFTPVDTTAAVGWMTLRVGEVSLPQVGLRGNDCANGLPEAYDVDADGVTTCGGDCDDLDPGVRPGMIETIDGVDEDCDGLIDDGTSAADDDGDGYCDDTVCTDGSTPGDCNDGDPLVNPGQTEVLSNGIDDDCDGVVDSGTADLDFDGYDPIIGGDCDDTNPTVYPGAPEIQDGLDNDCDGLFDENTPWTDDDGDGYCSAATCGDGSIAGDCDDTDAATYPYAPELADWRDNNCDGTVDEGTVNYDDDFDGYTETGGDCDDADPLASPALGTCP